MGRYISAFPFALEKGVRVIVSTTVELASESSEGLSAPSVPASGSSIANYPDKGKRNRTIRQWQAASHLGRGKGVVLVPFTGMRRELVVGKVAAHISQHAVLLGQAAPCQIPSIQDLRTIALQPTTHTVQPRK